LFLIEATSDELLAKDSPAAPGVIGDLRHGDPAAGVVVKHPLNESLEVV